MVCKVKSAFSGKKLIVTSVVALSLLITPAFVSAQGVQQQKRVQDPATHESGTPGSQDNGVQNQNQIQVQNQGEDQQLQVTTQEQESLQQGQDEDQVGGQPKSTAPRSEIARERMSVVAQAVEELLTTQGAKGGIGEQVRMVAREQQQAQEQIEDELDTIEARQGWVRSLFGPNYKAIGNLRQQTEQNQLRIQQLTQLQNQVTNQADEAQLEETVQALIEQNTALEEQVRAEERAGGVFGWLVKLLAK